MIAEVIVDIASSELDKIFDYKVATEGVLCGSRVIVPFGNRKIEGFVIKLKQTSDFPTHKLKPIIRVVDDIPALSEESLSLLDYMHKKYHTSRASILRLFLPSEMRKGKVRSKTVNFASLSNDVPVSDMLSSLRKNADNQKKLIQYLQEKIKERTGVLGELFSSSTITALANKGFITITQERVMRSPYSTLNATNKLVELTSEQDSAVKTVLDSNKPTLIHGVTGSGKTEVYLRLIEKTINDGKTAIMLVPEISLTPQMLSRLRSRFDDNCAIIHSGLSSGEKFDEWWRLLSGEAKIAIGARSAIFAPLKNVGIIIIDEEHEQSYESETNPRYVTSEIASFRANYNGAKLVFGSATPKVETYLKVKSGEYSLAEMKDRVNGKPLPEVIIADMKVEVRNGNPSHFSTALKVELEKTLNSGNQAIIFLNRRGYSQKVICRECGYVAKCSHCDVSLIYHRAENLLKCHYCGTAYNMLTGCPDCGSVNINYSGTGTQKVVDELNELFPNAKILRMDNDTTQNKEGHYKILKDFGDNKANILVGTQMIAKGHDFPNVTLVGILDADMSMFFSDYRALERTFQLITQVAGRSGRADSKGKVVLQTFNPNNTVLQYAIRYDYQNFYNREIALRKATHFPPYADIVRIMVESDDEDKAISVLKGVFFDSKDVYDSYQQSFVYFDKMKSPVKRIKNKHRFQVLCRIVSNKDVILDKLYSICDKYLTSDVLVYLEVNPTNMS